MPLKKCPCQSWLRTATLHIIRTAAIPYFSATMHIKAEKYFLLIAAVCFQSKDEWRKSFQVPYTPRNKLTAADLQKLTLAEKPEPRMPLLQYRPSAIGRSAPAQPRIRSAGMPPACLCDRNELCVTIFLYI